jgi:hypothetical protein
VLRRAACCTNPAVSHFPRPPLSYETTKKKRNATCASQSGHRLGAPTSAHRWWPFSSPCLLLLLEASQSMRPARMKRIDRRFQLSTIAAAEVLRSGFPARSSDRKNRRRENRRSSLAVATTSSTSDWVLLIPKGKCKQRTRPMQHPRVVLEVGKDRRRYRRTRCNRSPALRGAYLHLCTSPR